MKLTRFRLFWIIGLPAAFIYAFFAQNSPEGLLSIQIFRYITGIAFMLSLPGVVASVSSVRIAEIFVRIHKWYHRKHNVSYRPMPEYANGFPNLRSMVISSLINTFGIMYLILSYAGASNDGDPGIQFSMTLHVGLIFISLMLSSSLNAAIWLLSSHGIIFENHVDGTRSNLGSELRNNVAGFVGIVAVFDYVRSMFMGNSYNLSIGFILAALTFIAPSYIFSFYFLKKKHVMKLSQQLGKRLEKLI